MRTRVKTASGQSATGRLPHVSHRQMGGLLIVAGAAAALLAALANPLGSVTAASDGTRRSCSWSESS